MRTGRAALDFAQLGLDRVQQVRRFLLIHIQVAVARHAK